MVVVGYRKVHRTDPASQANGRYRNMPKGQWRKKMRKASLWKLAGSSLLALCAAAPALAQTQASLEEIIVTAQRREQSLQDVSISITAFSGEELQQLRVDRPQE